MADRDPDAVNSPSRVNVGKTHPEVGACSVGQRGAAGGREEPGDLFGDRKPHLEEAVQDVRAQSRRLEPALDPALVVSTRDAKAEELLQGDGVLLHADQL